MELQVASLGVGHGDALLLRWRGAEKKECWTCLVDGGASPEILRDHIRDLGVNYLDLVVGTHPDSDHIGGLIGIAEHVQGIASYWAPPLPAFERHLWLFGKNCTEAIKRSRAVEDSLKPIGTEVLYPVEGYFSAPFGPSGPRIHVLSPAARLVRQLLTTDDVSWLFASEVMPLGWVLAETEEEDVEQAPDVAAIGRALATGALRPGDISDSLRREREARSEEKTLAKARSAQAGTAPEFFGDSVLNNTSIVCWLEIPTDHRTHRLILPGDQENWTYLLARNPRGLHADVLKAPHHGGRLYLEQQDAHEEVFSHIRPRVVLVSGNGRHGLPRGSIREAAIRWGAAVLCTSERTQETIVGPEVDSTCCHQALGCDGSVSHNVELTLDRLGIRSQRRSCHPGLGSLPGPVVEVRQHIVNPSAILDRLAEHELRRHVAWVRKRLRTIYEQRRKHAAEMVSGSEPVSDAQLLALAPEEYRPVLAAHLPTILSKGWERGAFWAQSDGAYRSARWSSHTNATDNEVQDYLGRLAGKVIVLFPNSVDHVHRDPDSLVTRLEICGLAGFADATLHFPVPTFRATFWPAVVDALKGPDWHCYVQGKDAAFSPCADETKIFTALAMAFFKEKESWRGDVDYEFELRSDTFPYAAPVLISGKAGKRYEERPFEPYECIRLLEESWLPKTTSFSNTSLGWFIRHANSIGAVLKCRIAWHGRTYHYSSTSWDRDKGDEKRWPKDLVMTLESDLPVTFEIEGPYLAKLIERKPKLVEWTWLKEKRVERLW